MYGKSEITNNAGERELLITRIIDAPRELVFKVWTDPEHVIKWWGPAGFTNTIHEMDVRVGGVWRFMMHGPDGIDYPNKITYTEVVKPERLVYVHDSDTNTENDPTAFKSVVTFEELGDKTKLTMHVIFQTVEERDRVIKDYGVLEGNTQTLNKMEDYLREIR